MRVVLLLGCLFTQRATGYSIGTAFSAPCHERVTAAAFAQTPWLWASAIEPRRALDAAVGAALLAQVGVAVEGDARTFALMSLIVGVRAPDTEGRSLLYRRDGSARRRRNGRVGRGSRSRTA